MISSNQQFEGAFLLFELQGGVDPMNIPRYAESSTPSSLHDQVQCREPHVLRRKILMKTHIYSGLA